jgi:hypothetical protein
MGQSTIEEEEAYLHSCEHHENVKSRVIFYIRFFIFLKKGSETAYLCIPSEDVNCTYIFTDHVVCCVLMIYVELVLCKTGNSVQIYTHNYTQSSLVYLEFFFLLTLLLPGI